MHERVLFLSVNFAIAAHFGARVTVAFRRLRNPTRWDLLFIKFGLVPLCFVTFQFSKLAMITLGVPQTQF
ncbi:MAG: hypothetical protein EB141_04745 [Verrucomicrobia bacterium]|nr:hypothetical protein [Verrucomicrobiota bacterium]NBU10733.1 hypothetical protein [Pseudomonadota bacterium]NDA65643.1 hypothetical protein [Verrucomicrobiota bacterium]NDB74945.1 hypothetical protein [Verrucomicrobiota bacterium]NDD37522.1 hypothetical protein [Verrucomicrobiota bacterium]